MAASAVTNSVIARALDSVARAGSARGDGAGAGPMADVDDQALGRLELGLLIHVAQSDRRELARASRGQRLARGVLVLDREPDVLEARPDLTTVGAELQWQQRDIDVPVRQIDRSTPPTLDQLQAKRLLKEGRSTLDVLASDRDVADLGHAGQRTRPDRPQPT